MGKYNKRSVKVMSMLCQSLDCKLLYCSEKSGKNKSLFKTKEEMNKVLNKLLNEDIVCLRSLDMVQKLLYDLKSNDIFYYYNLTLHRNLKELSDVMGKDFTKLKMKKCGLFIFNGELFGEAIDNQDGVVYYWFRKLRKEFKTFELEEIQEKQNSYLFHSNIETYTTSLAPIIYKQIRENM